MSLQREVFATQNPALGAALLHSFANGFSPKDSDLRPIPMHLLFVVLSLVLHEKSRTIVLSTQKRSGIRVLERKLRSNLQDAVLSISTRARSWRDLTMKSLLLAVQSGLLIIDPDSAEVLVISRTTLKRSQVGDSVNEMLRAADRLGYWCAQVSTEEVLTVLKMEL